MLVAIDGACKRNGKPNCLSVGIAWIQTDDGKLLFKTKIETPSTSQRGELNGLLCALRYAKEFLAEGEDLIIITDSEYLYNTVELSWCFKWKDAGWINGSGEQAKNHLMWSEACDLLDSIGYERVFMQWTKGHLLAYTDRNAEMCMNEDKTGITLFERITTLANRPSEKDRVIDSFLKERNEHDKHKVPREAALSWVIANVTADCLAGYVRNLADNL